MVQQWTRTSNRLLALVGAEATPLLNFGFGGLHAGQFALQGGEFGSGRDAE